MKKLKTVMVSAAAMVDVDNKVLIAQRQKDKFMADYWEFPGGKLEDDELPNQCLVREIKEELGVDIRLLFHAHYLYNLRISRLFCNNLFVYM